MEFSKIFLVALMVLATEARRKSRFRNLEACVNQNTSMLVQESVCRPVHQPVPVPLPRGALSVHPKVVLVDRCTGMACNDPLSCAPTRTTTQSVPVYVHSLSGQTCDHVEVEVHTQCACECTKTCGRNEIFVEESCECVCRPDKRAMCEQMGRLWNEAQCECNCPLSQLTQCSSGKVFVQELCRCEPY